MDELERLAKELANNFYGDKGSYPSTHWLKLAKRVQRLLITARINEQELYHGYNQSLKDWRIDKEVRIADLNMQLAEIGGG